MDISRVIIGPVVTEKAERLKAGVPSKASAKSGETKRMHTLWVAPKATKIEVRNALRRFYGVEASSVRILNVRPKTRMISAHVEMEKRHAGRKAIVTLAKDSKALDLAAFQLTAS